jgi:hypothetical protein
MVGFTIVPRGRGDWIEAIQKDGSPQPIERYDTEDADVGRLRMLQEKDRIIHPEQRHPRDRSLYWQPTPRLVTFSLWRRGQPNRSARANHAISAEIVQNLGENKAGKSSRP